VEGPGEADVRGGVVVAVGVPGAGEGAAVEGMAVGAAGDVRPVGGAAALPGAAAAEHHPAAVGQQGVVLVIVVGPVLVARFGDGAAAGGPADAGGADVDGVGAAAAVGRVGPARSAAVPGAGG